jgi:polyisoprenoid-binding protein YceI
MTLVIALVLIAIAVFLWRTNGRDQYQLLAILQSTLAIAVFWMIGDSLSTDNGLIFTGLLTGILVIHFGISRFWKNKAFYWPPIFVLASTSLFFLFQRELFTFSDYDLNLIKPEILILPLLGSIIEPIANAKEKVLGDFFKIDYKNRRGISRGSFVFVIGLFLFVGHFVASYIGVSMVMLGFGASLLYHKRSGAVWNMYLGMIAFASFGYFATLSDLDTSNLLLGRVMEGLLFGGAISLFLNTLGRARKNQTIATVLSWFLFVVVPVLLIFLGTVNVNFGGVDSFIGLLAGFGFTALLGINTRKNSSLLAVYFAVGMLIIPMLSIQETEEMATIVLNSNQDEKLKEQIDLFEAAGQVIDATGEFEIDSKNSKITFELGPKGGRTKGAFKSFSGDFSLGDENKIAVIFPVKELTTFNSYRDESLMEDTYFNEPKFPEMTFVYTSMESLGDKYMVKGNFTMLGVSKEQKLEMKYLGKTGVSGAHVFIGRSKIDRTAYGMKSDPKEGDIVDFLFKVELK